LFLNGSVLTFNSNIIKLKNILCFYNFFLTGTKKTIINSMSSKNNLKLLSEFFKNFIGFVNNAEPNSYGFTVDS